MAQVKIDSAVKAIANMYGVEPNPLTHDEKASAAAAAMSALVGMRPATRGELQWHVQTFYGYRIPDAAACTDLGHCAPLDALWAAFNGDDDEAIWIGPRTGGKTLQFAILHHLLLSHNADTSANGGAVEEQAKKCYGYFLGFLNLPHFLPNKLKSMLSRTYLKNGGSLEIFPMTMARVNSPHTRVLALDEVELTTNQLIEESKSIPIRLHDRAPLTLYTSSRKRAYGPMERLLENTSIRQHFWCVLDVMERCPPTRHLEGKGCASCPIESFCRQRERNLEGIEMPVPGPGRASRANGWMKFEDVVAKFKSISWNVFRSQWLSRRPQTEGLVFPDFDEAIHVIDYEYNPAFPVAEGIDFGYVNPSVDVAFQLLPNDDIVLFDEIYVEGHTADQFAALIKSRPWFRPGNRRVADPANAGDRATLKNHGVPNEPADKSQKKGESSVEAGLNLMRWLLKPQGRSRPILYFARNAVNAIREVKTYHIAPVAKPDQQDPKEIPSKVDDHAMDGARYVLTAVYAGSLRV